MLIDFLDINKQKATELLELCNGNVKLGIVMYKYNLSYKEAVNSLNRFNNSINELILLSGCINLSEQSSC